MKTAPSKLSTSMWNGAVIGGSSAVVVVSSWILFQWEGALIVFLAILAAIATRRRRRSIRFFRFLLGYLTAVLGVAALLWAFAIWVGTSLDKEPYPAGLIVQLSVTCVVGFALILSGIYLLRGSAMPHTQSPPRLDPPVGD